MNTEYKSVKILHDIPMSDGTTFVKGDICEIRSIRRSFENNEINAVLVKRSPHEESYLVTVKDIEFVSPEKETQEEPVPETFQFHYTSHPDNKIYLLIDDVAEFIKDIASTETMDVRNRLEQAAANVLKLKGDATC